MKVAIVGAGIAGLACATKLRSSGMSPYIFDKGKRAGGRLSTLKLHDSEWDFGCPYLSATHPDFVWQAQRWMELGWIARWTDGPADALVGVPTMASLVSRQCADHHVQFQAEVQHVAAHDKGWLLCGTNLRQGPFDAVVFALPSEQAAPLLSLLDMSMAQEAAVSRSAPCWSLMVAFDSPLTSLGTYYQSNGPIAGAFRTKSKPQRQGAETWVIQANASWSQRHLEENADQVAAALLDQFRAVQSNDLPPHYFLKAHRWRFAQSYGQCGHILWNAKLKIGACGDWCTSSGVEGAWLSGNQLADQLIKDLL